MLILVNQEIFIIPLPKLLQNHKIFSSFRNLMDSKINSTNKTRLQDLCAFFEYYLTTLNFTPRWAIATNIIKIINT